MEFLILGPLEVVRDSHPLSLGGARQRALLAMLLLHANETVVADRLAEDLWAQPPASASSALQVYIARLRKSLEPEREKGAPSVLETHSPGYALRVEPDELDAQLFEDLLADGRRAREAGDPVAAAPALRRALELWRGPALADFTYEPFAQAEIARLEELRLDAIEERIEADLGLGHAQDLVGELESITREHPLRERLRCQLMLALYRAGRQAEALEVYRSTQAALDEGLGISPSPALQELEHAILNQEPGLDFEAPDPGAGVDVSAPATAADPDPPVPETDTRKTITALAASSEARPGEDPEALRRRQERFLSGARGAVERHGGVLEGALGEDVLALFGVPRAHEDDALRAGRAALELRVAPAAPGAGDGEDAGGLVRIGIATGEALITESASGERSTVGEPLALAARLRGEAAPGEILLAEGTARLLRGAARVEPQGVGDSRVLLTGLAPEPPPLARPVDAPITGREHELAQLRETFNRAVASSAVELCTVLGPAGIGKSRLARELASEVGEDAVVLAGRCLAYGEGITFWPLREMVEQLSAAELIRELLDADPHGERVAEAVGEVARASDTSGSREEVFSAFRRMFESIAIERPLLLLFEDIHWAEPTLLDFIDYLVDRARGSPILVLCLARLELLESRPAWGGGKPRAGSLLLEPLSEAESGALIDSLGGRLTSRTRSRVREVGEGNPLFLEQMLAMLAEGTAGRDLAIPATIRAVLAARLDRLGPGERAVLERAAVVGREFDAQLVADLLPGEAGSFTGSHLDALVRREFIRPARSVSGIEAFRFRHILIQQAAYGAMPKRLRRDLHERIAGRLEAGTAEDLADLEEILGYHLEQAALLGHELEPGGEDAADLARRGAERLGAAGRRAFARGDMPAAANLLARAVNLRDEDDPVAVALTSDLGYALFEIGDLERADRVLTDAIERASAVGDADAEWHARVKGGHVRMYADPAALDAAALERDARRAVATFEELSDDSGLARALMTLAELSWWRGDVRASQEDSTRAAEHARVAGSRREHTWSLGMLAFCLMFGPTPAPDGARRLRDLIEEHAENPMIEANLLCPLAVLEAMCGSSAAAEHMDRGLAMTRDLGLGRLESIHRQLRADVRLLLGDPAGAADDLRAAYEIFEESGDRWFLASVVVDLVRAVHAEGNDAEAERLAKRINRTPMEHDLEWQIKRREATAPLLARRGQVAKAESVAREAVGLAAASDFLGYQADSCLVLAEVLQNDGRGAEAEAAAAEAARVYERKGNVVAAVRAREIAAAVV